MLNKEEEQRLKGLTEKIAFCKEDLKYPKLNAYDIEWLARKLKGTNDEFKKLWDQHNEVDKMLATALYVIDCAELTHEYLKLRKQ